MKLALTTLLFLFNILASATTMDATYLLQSENSSARNCPTSLNISTKDQLISTTLSHLDGLKNYNTFNLNAPVGLIKGLAYPFGAFSYYRNHQDHNGFYFQRKNCERIGVFKECGEWTNMQSFIFSGNETVEFKLRDLFYRLNSDDYPTDIGRLPLSGHCTYKK